MITPVESTIKSVIQGQEDCFEPFTVADGGRRAAYTSLINCNLLHSFISDCLYLKLTDTCVLVLCCVSFAVRRQLRHLQSPSLPSSASHLFPLFTLSSLVPARPHWSATRCGDNLILKGYLSKFSFSPKPSSR